MSSSALLINAPVCSDTKRNFLRHATQKPEAYKMDGTAFCIECMDSWIIYMVSRSFPCHSEVKELKIFNINGNMATKEAKQEIKSESC